MYPTNEQIAATLSPAARVGVALFWAVLSVYCVWLLIPAVGNAIEGVRQVYERQALLS